MAQFKSMEEPGLTPEISGLVWPASSWEDQQLVGGVGWLLGHQLST